MVIEWLDPVVFRWIVVAIWLLAAAIGLLVCGGNYHKARDRRKEFFKDGPESARKGVIHRHRIQKRLFIAMCAAAAVGVLATILPRPILPPITVFSLLGNGLLLWFIGLISSLSVEVRRYEAEVIEAQAVADEDTLQQILSTVKRTEAGDVVVAEGRVEAKAAVDGVARDLKVAQRAVDDLKAEGEAAQSRADAVHPEADPGAAADAASQSGEKE